LTVVRRYPKHSLSMLGVLNGLIFPNKIVIKTEQETPTKVDEIYFEKG
jgi:hypothetical protein